MFSKSDLTGCIIFKSLLLTVKWRRMLKFLYNCVIFTFKSAFKNTVHLLICVFCLFVCMYVCMCDMYVHCVHVWYPWKYASQKNVRGPLELWPGGKPTCACRELNPGPLQSNKCSELQSQVSPHRGPLLGLTCSQCPRSGSCTAYPVRFGPGLLRLSRHICLLSSVTSALPWVPFSVLCKSQVCFKES